MKRMVSLTLLSLIAACAASETRVDKSVASLPGKELIVLAPPPDGDVYYADQLDSIFEFHVEYARKIAERDDVLILSGDDFYDDYVAELGADKNEVFNRIGHPLRQARLNRSRVLELVCRCENRVQIKC